MSDVRSGGPGSIPPEHETKLQLSEWLETGGSGDVRILWEQKTSDYPTFHVTGGDGTPAKPDLVYDGRWHTLGIEVKTGDSAAGVYDGVLQTARYWETYTDGVKQYTDNEGRDLDLDGFVLATAHSLYGRLYDDTLDVVIHPDGGTMGDGRARAIDNGDLPRFEHAMTEQSTRLLWRLAKNRSDPPIQTGIGALLSTATERADDAGGLPAVLWWHTDQQGWTHL